MSERLSILISEPDWSNIEQFHKGFKNDSCFDCLKKIMSNDFLISVINRLVI